MQSSPVSQKGVCVFLAFCMKVISHCPPFRRRDQMACCYYKIRICNVLAVVFQVTHRYSCSLLKMKMHLCMNFGNRNTYVIHKMQICNSQIRVTLSSVVFTALGACLDFVALPRERKDLMSPGTQKLLLQACESNSPQRKSCKAQQGQMVIQRKRYHAKAQRSDVLKLLSFQEKDVVI